MVIHEHFATLAGRLMFALEAGSGSPTVVFEAGMGDFSRAWHPVQPRIAEHTRTISYDRAGRGQSNFAGVNRTLEDCLVDLRALLEALDAPPPYVLVGHSFGGGIVRVFAHRYPDEVAGIVLVDSSQEDAFFRFRDIQSDGVLPPRSFDEPPWLTWARFYQSLHLDPSFPRNVFLNDEGIDLAACFDQVRAATSLGDKPLTVITGTKRDWERKNGAEGLVAEWEIASERAWIACQEKLLELSSRATWVRAEESGHYVQEDQPDLVIGAIEQMLETLEEPSKKT